MSFCLTCALWVEVPCAPDIPANDNVPVPANDNDPGARPIIVAADNDLRRIDCVQELATRIVELDMPQRVIPNWLTDLIFNFPGLVLYPGGKPFPIPDTLVDDVFNDDGSFRWLSDFKRVARIRPKQNPQIRVLPRLRVIRLAFQISDRD